MLCVIATGAMAALSAPPPTITCDPNDPAKCDCDGEPIGPHTWTPPGWLISNKTSLYETSAMYDGVLTQLSKFKAKATMLVNVASA